MTEAPTVDMDISHAFEIKCHFLSFESPLFSKVSTVNVLQPERITESKHMDITEQKALFMWVSITLGTWVHTLCCPVVCCGLPQCVHKASVTNNVTQVYGRQLQERIQLLVKSVGEKTVLLPFHMVFRFLHLTFNVGLV